uniref:Uncharacterized protein n=1 Tax=Aegilops tauschii subsp. strangulata TaxID=200361 RepID=A0A452XZY9_AEGTS
MLLPRKVLRAGARSAAAGPVEAAAASVLGQAAAAVRLAVPRYERDDVAPAYADDCASGMSIAQRWFLAKERCTVLAIRSCVEWEPETFPLVEALLGKPVVPLGLLPPSADGGRRRAAGSSEDHVTLRWLEEQPPDSVVYIALGSEVPLSVEQVQELALGLELAGTRFLWALRKPAGAVVDNDDALPPGFQDRTRGHGPWGGDHGMGAPDQHPGARRRGRVPDALRPELAHRRASVRAPTRHAAHLRGPGPECPPNGVEEGRVAGGEGRRRRVVRPPWRCGCRPDRHAGRRSQEGICGGCPQDAGDRGRQGTA